MTNQQKAKISFKIVTLPEKNIRILLLSQEIFNLILIMLILTKIIITETLYSMFIYWLQKNLNLFSLDRKLADKTKRKMIHMLWKECMPDKFYKHICKEKNFLYLKGKNVLQPKVLKIISEFIDEDKSNSYKINLSSYKIILQYVYSKRLS